MIEILKYTYLLDNKSLARRVDKLWRRYQRLIDDKNSSWQDANEARALLYVLGYLFPEVIALECLERRVSVIEPKIKLDSFLEAVDSDNKAILTRYSNNKKFNELKKFYQIVKAIKNKVNKDATYLDEETFNRFYDKKKPRGYY